MQPNKPLDAVIIGAGLTGLTVGHYLLKHQSHNFLVLEKENRAGGQIHSYHSDGFTFESGPTSGIISSPEVAELFEDFPAQLSVATPLAKRRMILKNKKFHPLPSGLVSAITTTLFSPSDKLRILGEPFRRKGDDPNESIAQLVRRRLGESYYTYAVDPFVGGIYAGDAQKLVTRHALPKLYALEQNHGSFIRGAIALMRKKKDSRELKASKEIFSSPSGLSTLTNALAEELSQNQKLCLNAQNIKFLYRDDLQLWQITYTNKDDKPIEIYSKQVITTIGSLELASALQTSIDLSPILAMRYAPIVQVALGYKEVKNFDFASFGGLIPSVEDAEVLGILNPSACFRDRCPEGGLLLSIFLGGMRSPSLIDQSDSYIKDLVTSRVREFLGLTQSPDLIRIFRHPRAIPQYEVSSDSRIALIKQLEKVYPGLYIGGNLYQGIGMSDRIKQGTLLASRALNI